jgi:hypothetical protein
MYCVKIKPVVLGGVHCTVNSKYVHMWPEIKDGLTRVLIQLLLVMFKFAVLLSIWPDV